MIKQLVIPQIHYATDRRCFQGAYCSDMEREIGSKKKARDILTKAGVGITYFPAGSFYVGFKTSPDVAPQIITKDCTSFESCVIECVKYLRDNGLDIAYGRKER